jgi:hypothetical protein
MSLGKGRDGRSRAGRKAGKTRQIEGSGDCRGEREGTRERLPTGIN